MIGIVASRIAERHHRPAVLIALDGAEGTGSGRSIPAFDLLGGLDACAGELLRHGGHRAAAGLTIARDRVEAFGAAFAAHAAAILTPDDLIPRRRVDAVVPGDVLQLGLAEELERLAPFGMGNPEPSLLVPSALLADPRPMGEGRHVAFTLAAGGARSRCVSFGRGSALPAGPDEPVDAAVRLEVNRYNGAVEPRLVLRHAQPARPAPIALVGELPLADAIRAELACDPDAWGDDRGGPGGRVVRDARDGGIAGLLGDLVAAGEPVLAVAAHARQRAAVLGDRVGGFALTTWAALEADPGLAAPFAHVVAVDPPAHAHLRALAEALPGEGWTHLAWGAGERELARTVLAWELDLRPQLAELYRALRGAPQHAGEPLLATLRGTAPQPRSGALIGRLLRVLVRARPGHRDRRAARRRRPGAGRPDRPGTLAGVPRLRAPAGRRPRLPGGRTRRHPAGGGGLSHASDADLTTPPARGWIPGNAGRGRPGRGHPGGRSCASRSRRRSSPVWSYSRSAPPALAADVAIDGTRALPDRDTRSGQIRPAAAQRADARALGARVNWNRFGTPSSLVDPGGALATGVRGATPAAAARAWLDANAALFRLDSADGLELQSDNALAGGAGARGHLPPGRRRPRRLRRRPRHDRPRGATATGA